MSLIESDLRNNGRKTINKIKEGLMQCLETEGKTCEYCGYKFKYNEKEGYFTITCDDPFIEVTYARKNENNRIGYEFWVSPEFDERNYLVKNIIL